MRVLITGIKGFIGRNLIDAFSGFELCGLGTKEEYYKDIYVYNSDDLNSIEFSPDVIIICHAAVESGNKVISNEILFDINIGLTEKICHKFIHSYIIYISTASVYSVDCGIISEKSCLKPQSNYAISKLWGETVALAINTRVTIIRLSSVYGIGMKENTLVPNYVNQALCNNVIDVWGDGSRFQNYIYVGDVVRLIKKITLASNFYFGKILLGVSSVQYTNLQIAKFVSKITKSDIQFLNSDHSVSLEYDNSYTKRITGIEFDTCVYKKLKEYIKWKKEGS